MSARRILLVEDTPALARGLRNSLEIAGFEVVVAPDGATGLQQARTAAPDLVILDLMLPDLDGRHVLRALREGGSQLPVLVLTALGEEADKVMGFRLGADDYVTKPFGVLELVARVEALLRRSAPPVAAEVVRFGQVEIDTRGRMVRRGGEAVDLTPREFDLLLTLARRPGEVLSRALLLKEVWGHRAAVISRTVDTHVAELRRKLEDDPSHPRHITTVWKAGYRFLP